MSWEIVRGPTSPGSDWEPFAVVAGSIWWRRRRRPRARDDTDLLRAEDLAGILGVDTSTLRRWVKAGRFPAPMRLGRTVRWRRSDLSHLLGLLVSAFLDRLGI